MGRTMRRRGIALLALCLVLPVGVAHSATSTTEPQLLPAHGFVPGEVLLRFGRSASEATRTQVLDAIGGTIVATIAPLRVHRVKLASLEVRAAIRVARDMAGVDFIEGNRVGRMAGELLPNDRCFGTGCGLGRLWSLDAINAPAGWGVYPGAFDTAASKTTAAIKVAVLDTQIAFDRLDWKNAGSGSTSNAQDVRFGGQLDIADAATFVTDRPTSGSSEYHGTFIAGILGASANNATDVAGVAFHAQLMPVTVIDGNGATTAFDLSAGITHAVDRGARVINMSLGLTGPAQTVELAIQRAAQRHILMVAAAGNNANDAPFYPAFYSGVMSVTASNAADRAGSCTNHSAKTSVAAPGAGVVGLDPRAQGGLSIVNCGTSTATPHVSGLAALLMAQHPGRTAVDVRKIIEATADDDVIRPGRDEYFGAGRINVERALRYNDHTPTVSRLEIEIPPNLGGAAKTMATATAEAPTTILDAELFVERLGAPGTGIPMTAADGTFDEESEQLKATLRTTLQQPPGAYRVWVRARNATGWGPASTGALLIDRTAPTVSIEAADPMFAVGGAEVPASLVVELYDDFGINGRVRYEVTSAVTGHYVTSSQPMTVPFGDRVNLSWQPALGTTGLYDLTVEVTDEAGNTARATRRVVVV